MVNNQQKPGDIKLGTVVRLKSGGPEMTCREIPDSAGQVVCVWFDGKEPKVHEFTSGMLEVVSGDEPDAVIE